MKKKFCYTLVIVTVLIAASAFIWPGMLYALVILGPLLIVAAYDLFQTKHTILRNYPVIGHVRYMLEDVRHHIRPLLSG